MLTIRLSRIGKKKQPSYRLIISEKHKDPWGDYLELLGNYNPRTKELNIKSERIKYWLSCGAQCSNTVHNLLLKNGLISDQKKKKVVKITKRRRTKKEVEVAKPAAAKNEEPIKKEEAPKEEAPKPEKAKEPKTTEEGK